MLKGFGYIRVSGRAQVNGDGFQRQETAIRAYAKAYDIKLIRVFQEEGISGAREISQRPAFISMLEALHSSGIQVVLVESLGRLARDLMIQESIIHDLNRNGYTLVSVTEPDLCCDDHSRKFMRQIMGAFHEYEKQMVVVKLRGARQRLKMKQGRCEGRKPYGHNSNERPILNRMIDLQNSGLTITDIARTLTSEGYKARNGGEWLQPTVSKILKRVRTTTSHARCD